MPQMITTLMAELTPSDRSVPTLSTALPTDATDLYSFPIYGWTVNSYTLSLTAVPSPSSAPTNTYEKRPSQCQKPFVRHRLGPLMNRLSHDMHPGM